MAEPRDWNSMKDMMKRLLVERTGKDTSYWNAVIKKEKLPDPGSLRSWLKTRGITGYAQTHLVMETFGYPDYMELKGSELIDEQYRDRQALRPIYEAVVAAAVRLGDVTIQARKTYVALVTSRRTFARIQPTTRNRLDVALRLERAKPGGRLKVSKIQEQMKVQVELMSVEDLDTVVRSLLRSAWMENR